MFNSSVVRPAFRYAIIISLLLIACLLYFNVYESRTSWYNIAFPTADVEEETQRPQLQTSSVLADSAAIVTATSVVPLSISSSIQATSKALPTTLSTITLSASVSKPPSPLPSSSDSDDDGKIIVIAHLQKEDTSWVAENLPDWQRAIYVVDNTSAPLHVDRNKGREANVYLTYVIENYAKLPKVIVFLHPHRNGYPQAWHNDAPGYDNVISIKQLKLDFIQKNGYANLRCNPSVGCPDEVQPFRDPPDLSKTTERAYAAAWKAMMKNDDVPHTVGVACCSQFAVSRDQVLQRPKSDYERYRKWLMDTELDDDTSGRVFEYMWHVIYGKDPV